MYRVNEIFYSLQGEGMHTGTPAVFVRLSGCNLKCPFCDTDHRRAVLMSANEIIAEVKRFPAKTVVLTGGEPLMQADAELLEAFSNAGLRVHVETNGTYPLPAPVHWVTYSPKQGGQPAIDMRDVSELKVVFDGRTEHELEDIYRATGCENAFLQPCSGKNVPQTIEYIMQHPHWRLSLQTHKMLDIR